MITSSHAAYLGRAVVLISDRRQINKALGFPSSRNLVRDHSLHFGLVSLIDQRIQIQAPLGLLLLRSKNVAHERVPTLHMTARGLLEALGSSLMGLQFRHRTSANNSNPQPGVACWGLH